MLKSGIADNIISEYVARLTEDLEIMRTENGDYLITPFTRPDGEGISLSIVTLSDGSVHLSDMGDTLGYLFVNGLTLSKNVIGKAQRISVKYGVSFDRNSLSVTCNPGETGHGVHNLAQAILAVSNLIYVRQPNSRALFSNEVESFIISVGVAYDSDYKVKGQQKVHQFKFHINSGRNLLVQPLSAATTGAAQSLAERWAFRFVDTVAQNETWRPVAILDDRKSRKALWVGRTLDLFQDSAILWADKGRLAALLTS